MKSKLTKRKVTIIVGVILGVLLSLILIIAALSLYYEKTTSEAKNISYGVTFSPIAAEELNLDWHEVYISMLDDLRVRDLRLPSYWNVVEKEQGVFNFEDTDFMLSEAASRSAKVIQVVGLKQPRWPECFAPVWARELNTKDRQEKTLLYIKTVVERYKDNPAIVSWQVENEPYFYPFGEGCYPPDDKFIKQEVALVRSLDSRPIVIAETGELAPWMTQAQISDILGISLYRTVWNPVTGYFSYPFNPGFYTLRSDFFRKVFAPNNQKTIITELQAEPWSPVNKLADVALSEQAEIFSVEDFKTNVQFARKTGIDEIYLWGVEWWYFMQINNQSQYWDYAKTLFQQ